jgi:hypothetical protein
MIEVLNNNMRGGMFQKGFMIGLMFESDISPMATSKSPTCGRVKIPRPRHIIPY